MTILDKLRAAAASDVDGSAQFVCTFDDVRAIAERIETYSRVNEEDSRDYAELRAERDALASRFDHIDSERNALKAEVERLTKVAGDARLIDVCAENDALKAEVERLRADLNAVVASGDDRFRQLADLGRKLGITALRDVAQLHEAVDRLRTTTPRVTEAMRAFLDDNALARDSIRLWRDGAADDDNMITLGDLRALATAQPVETVAMPMLPATDEGNALADSLMAEAWSESRRQAWSESRRPFETVARRRLPDGTPLATSLPPEKVLTPADFERLNEESQQLVAKLEADEAYDAAVRRWRERFERRQDRSGMFDGDAVLDAIEARFQTEQLIARGRR